jgi:transposase
MPYAGAMPPAEILRAENLALKREVEELKGTNALLKWQIEKLQKQVFGPGKSEKLDRAQLLFQLKELEAMAEKAARPAQAVSYERRAPAPEKRTTPAELFAKLPVKEVVVVEPDEVKAQPEAYEQIGEERTFEVEITPPQLLQAGDRAPQIQG